MWEEKAALPGFASVRGVQQLSLNHLVCVLTGAVPLEPGDLRAHAGAAAFAVALCRRARLRPAAVICAIMNPEGDMAGPDELAAFALAHGLPLARTGALAARLGSADEAAGAQASGR